MEHAWRIAGCFFQAVWTPWRCRCMWPLSVAVDGGRGCMIRWGARPGIVVSSELCARAWRSVGVGGEHSMVASRGGGCNVGSHGREGQCSGWREHWWNTGYQWNHPQSSAHAVAAAQFVMVHVIFVKRTSHPALKSVTTLRNECNAKPGGMMWARRAVAGSLGKSNVHMCMDCTWSLLGRHAAMGLLASCTPVRGAPVARKLLIVLDCKTAYLLMVSMSMLTVQRSAAAARAYWTGIGQEDKILWFSLILIVLSSPAHQKLVYQPRLAGVGGPYGGGGAC